MSPAPALGGFHVLTFRSSDAFHASLPQGNSLLTMDQYGQLTEAIWDLVHSLLDELKSPQRCCSYLSIVHQIHICWEMYVNVLFRQVRVGEYRYVVRCLSSYVFSCHRSVICLLR